MGLAIYGLDMLLRPNFANGGMELLLFGLEGIACDLIYGMIKKSNDYSAGFGSNITLGRSLMAGGTIWLTDMLLKPEMFRGLGSEIFKFLLQGIIVMFVFGFSGASS